MTIRQFLKRLKGHYNSHIIIYSNENDWQKPLFEADEKNIDTIYLDCYFDKFDFYFSEKYGKHFIEFYLVAGFDFD